MTEQITSEGITGQEHLILQCWIVDRLAFLNDFPVQQHDLAELGVFAEIGGDVGDHVHDERGVGFIVDEALDEILDGFEFFVDGGVGDAGFDLFDVGGIVAGADVEIAAFHGVDIKFNTRSQSYNNILSDLNDPSYRA